MVKLLGSLVLVVSLSACYSTTQRPIVAEPADPIVGDLHCAKPRMTILEALYGVPYDSEATAVCEPR